MLDATVLITKLLEVAKNKISQYTVIMLANVCGRTKNHVDYPSTTIQTEFLTINEYEELLDALQKFGFYTIVYFDVNDFFNDYFSGKYKNDSLILFEGTQKGIGHAKDSLIPSFCDLESLPHTGPNAFFNSICSNKYQWTQLLKQHGIPTPKSWRYDMGSGWLLKNCPNTDNRLIAKPVYECASIGVGNESVSVLTTEYERYLEETAAQYQQPLIVQEFIAGYEVEVPVIFTLNGMALLPPVVLVKDENPYMGESFLNFENVYNDDYAFTLLKNIESTWVPVVNSYVQKAISLLELNSSYARVDFRIDRTGNCFITDINSYPHIIEHSSYAYAFQAIGLEKDLILPCIIGNALNCLY